MIHGQCPHHDSQQKKKTNKNIGGRKIHEYGKPKAPTNFFSNTLLFNLLALQWINMIAN
jgi:hypothetical protein